MMRDHNGKRVKIWNIRMEHRQTRMVEPKCCENDKVSQGVFQSSGFFYIGKEKKFWNRRFAGEKAGKVPSFLYLFILSLS